MAHNINTLVVPKFPARNVTVLAIVGVLCVGIPILLYQVGAISSYTARILSMGGVNAIMAMSVNMITGITGQLSLGQAGFLAVGSYSCVVLTVDAGLPIPLAVLCAALITAFIGFLIGFPVLKLTGDYLAIVTLGFGEIIRVVFINIKSITNGANGRAFPNPVQMNSALALLTVTSMVVICLVFIQNFLRSSYGRVIMSCREDEIAANSCGIPIFRYKMAGFVSAAFLAGLGGSMFALVEGFVKPTDAQFLQSFNYLMYAVIGGLGSMTGSIIGAYLLTYLQEALRFMQDYRMVMYPVVLILVMIFRPQGIMGMKEFSIVGFVNKLTHFEGARFNKIGKKEARS
jgi:branched-chain amino acid transport system permease protein